MIDLWNPDTFSAELKDVLNAGSKLIRAYYVEENRLLHEHLNSVPYKSLGSNIFSNQLHAFEEESVIPVLDGAQIRAWHYTRLMDHEVRLIQKALIPSSMEYLNRRIEDLVVKKVLSPQEAARLLSDSPYQVQAEARLGKFWAVAVPIKFSDPDVKLLLESWGGESVYFRVRDRMLEMKLKTLGCPRILEIKLFLSDRHNVSQASETVVRAWAKQLGVSVRTHFWDISIKDCASASVVRVHSEGEETFDAIASTYPQGVAAKISVMQ